MQEDLIFLRKGGATPRVLDVFSVTEKLRKDASVGERFFQTPQLNDAFYVKHAPRQNEKDFFFEPPSVATKIIFPINRGDLTAGGHSIFIEEKRFEDKLKQFLGEAESDRLDQDMRILTLLSDIPSFDPFLLHESVKPLNPNIPKYYFSITDHDLFRLRSYVSGRIAGIVKVAMSADSSTDVSNKAMRFVAAIMSDDDGERDKRRFLQAALQMDETQFEAGMFGWKGVLYYHWSLASSTTQLNHFIQDFRRLSPMGATPMELSEINRMKIWVAKEAVNRYRMLKDILNEYDRNFSTFVETRDPTRFREFLIKAPAIFQRIGLHISSINHVCTYWKFHTKGEPRALSVTEAYDLLRNFKTSLTYRNENESDEALAV